MISPAVPRPFERGAEKGSVMRVSAAILATVSVFLQTSSAAQACGDKFVLVGRGVEFHRAYAAVYPALIVIYAKPQGHAAKAISDPQLQKDLKLSGQRVLLAENDAQLARALDTDHPDLILTDVADAERMSKQAAGAPSKPTVLPVMYQPTKEEVAAIQKNYQCRLTSGDHADRYLSAIDNAMKIRVDEKKKRSQP
jgi:hypothetical protein